VPDSEFDAPEAVVAVAADADDDALAAPIPAYAGVVVECGFGGNAAQFEAVVVAGAAEPAPAELGVPICDARADAIDAALEPAFAVADA